MKHHPRKHLKWIAFFAAAGFCGIWLATTKYPKPSTPPSGVVEPSAHFESFPAAADHLEKIAFGIGDRNGASENSVKNLSKTASTIEAVLQAAKPAYSVKRTAGPADWSLIHASIAGKKPKSPAVWVLSSYDSRPGSPGVEANASGLAAVLTAAEVLASAKPEADIHFVFIPHANDPESPVLETAEKFLRICTEAGKPKAILCVEAMGTGKSLWLSSRDTSAAPLALVNGLGTVKGAEVICLGDDVDLASVLFQMDLPAVRVATRPIVTPAEPDDTRPTAEILADSTGRLVELIRRCAGLK